MADVEKKPGKKVSPLCTRDRHEQCAGKGCACACHVCTWKGCSRKAAHRQIAQDGDKWAYLCEEHNTQLEEAIMGGEANTLLHCWTMAGGGPEKMAARLASGAAERLSDLLRKVGKGDNAQADSAPAAAANGSRLYSNQAWGLRAFFARNTMRPGRVPQRMRTPMFLIDSHGKRPVCVACHRLGPYQEGEPGVFICEACMQAADAHLRELAEIVPELRDHRLKRWRSGCDCERCRRRGDRAV